MRWKALTGFIEWNNRSFEIQVTKIESNSLKIRTENYGQILTQEIIYK